MPITPKGVHYRGCDIHIGLSPLKVGVIVDPERAWLLRTQVNMDRVCGHTNVGCASG